MADVQGTVLPDAIITADIVTVIPPGYNVIETATDGDDFIRAWNGDDLVMSGDGDDQVLAGNGDDEVSTGDGDDWAYGGLGFDTLYGGDGDDTVYGGAGDDYAYDGAQDDQIEGGDGIDRLIGQAGNDRLSGDEDADYLYGGFGADIALYFGSFAGVTVDLATGRGLGGAAEGDWLFEIEGITGSAYDDALRGDAGSNALNGSLGNDVLTGRGGGDRLDGGDGIDRADYAASGAAVTVDLATGLATDGDAGGDSFVSIEDVGGSAFGDTIAGTGGANGLAGGAGNDTLRGGAGGDRLDGGAGIDTVTYTESGIGVVISLPAVQVSGGHAQGDLLIGIENLHGSAGADSLTGDGLANVLNGWAGKDQLTGGGGADRFTFHAVTHSGVGETADRIADFSRTQGDRIDLSVIDADTTQAGNQGFSFIGTGTYSGAVGQLRYQQFADGTVVAGDVNGDGASDFHIRCAGAIAFTATDFVL
ncbi:hypothetical protein KXR53_33935 [Inquilinus limosus]|uniref:calcium-binding protein n=1 Tax=Inquilinus limosus TaxID=171674 RepID=UPI003F191291